MKRFIAILFFCLAALVPQRAGAQTILGKSPVDKMLPGFMAQNTNANTIIAGLNNANPPYTLDAWHLTQGTLNSNIFDPATLAVFELIGGGGGGNVNGPGSSVNGNLAMFNGTTGKALADSGLSPARVITNNYGGTFSANGLSANGTVTGLSLYFDNGSIVSDGFGELTIRRLSSDGGAMATDGAGDVTAANFRGGGSGLTSLNASQLTSGTVPQALLPATVVTNNDQNARTLSNSVTFAGTVLLENTVRLGQWQLSTNPADNSLVISNTTMLTAPLRILTNGVQTNNGTVIATNLAISGGGPLLNYASGFWDFRPTLWSGGGIQWENFSGGGGFVLASGNYSGGTAGGSVQVQRTGTILFDSASGATFNQTINVGGSSSLDGGNITTDGSGILTVNGLGDNGDASVSGNLTVTGTINTDNGNIISDGSGGLTTANLSTGSASASSFNGGTFSGNGSGLSSLSSSQLTGALPRAVYSGTDIITNLNSGLAILSGGVSSKKNNGNQPAVITVSGSPFFWTNTTLAGGASVVVGISGGAIQGVGINGGLWSVGPTNGFVSVVLQTNEYVGITNTAAPKAFWKAF